DFIRHKSQNSHSLPEKDNNHKAEENKVNEKVNNENENNNENKKRKGEKEPVVDCTTNNSKNEERIVQEIGKKYYRECLKVFLRAGCSSGDLNDLKYLRYIIVNIIFDFDI